MNIDTILDQIFILPRDSKSVLKDLISEVEFPKDSIIIKAGKVEKTIYFIKKGIGKRKVTTPSIPIHHFRFHVHVSLPLLLI